VSWWTATVACEGTESFGRGAEDLAGHLRRDLRHDQEPRVRLAPRPSRACASRCRPWSWPPAVAVADRAEREARFQAGLPRRHVRVEVALTYGPRAVEVARRVRTAVGVELDGQPTMAVPVTCVG
jgi:hypothetical protein